MLKILSFVSFFLIKITKAFEDTNDSSILVENMRKIEIEDSSSVSSSTDNESEERESDLQYVSSDSYSSNDDGFNKKGVIEEKRNETGDEIITKIQCVFEDDAISCYSCDFVSGTYSDDLKNGIDQLLRLICSDYIMESKKMNQESIAEANEIYE